MNLKETLLAVVQQTQENIPPEARFQEEEVEVLLRHREKILALEDRIVQGFYDILFAHPKTAQVFREGERPAREKTLEGWLERTLSGPFNEDYWVWQAWVGVVHLDRGVTTEMMASMWAWMVDTIKAGLLEQGVEAVEVRRVGRALVRLKAIVLALVETTYKKFLIKAVAEETGLEEGLVLRIARQGVEDNVQAWREERKKLGL
jgi:hypothetical protein